MNSSELLTLLTSGEFACPFQRHEKIYNMAQSAQLELSLPGLRCKNLLVRDKKGQLFLLVTRPDNAVDLSTVRIALGCGRLSLASSEQLFEALDVMPGALSPLALINDVERRVMLIMDQTLEDVSFYLFHPLDNGVSVQLTKTTLALFLKGTGHCARWLDTGASC